MIFNLTFCYIDDVLSLNNPNDCIDAFNRSNFEIKDTTGASKWANYIDHHLVFDKDGKLFTQLFNKHNDKDFSQFSIP